MVCVCGLDVSISFCRTEKMMEALRHRVQLRVGEAWQLAGGAMSSLAQMEMQFAYGCDGAHYASQQIGC